MDKEPYSIQDTLNEIRRKDLIESKEHLQWMIDNSSYIKQKFKDLGIELQDSKDNYKSFVTLLDELKGIF